MVLMAGVLISCLQHFASPLLVLGDIWTKFPFISQGHAGFPERTFLVCYLRLACGLTLFYCLRIPAEARADRRSPISSRHYACLVFIESHRSIGLEAEGLLQLDIYRHVVG